MPFVSIKVSSKLDDTKKQAIAVGITNLLVEILKKERSLSTVLIEEVGNNWYIDSNCTDHQIQVFVEINITKGTNSEVEKSTMLESTFNLLENVLGSLSLATYIIIHEHENINWGFSGKTQKQRQSI